MTIVRSAFPVRRASALLALLMTAGTCVYADAPMASVAPAVRALWVKPPDGPEALDAMVRSATRAGFNALIVDAGRAYAVAPAAGEDRLTRLVERAHAAGLRVHLAVDVLQAAAAGEIPASRDHVLYRHPEWLMVPRLLASELLHVDLKSPEYFGTLLRHARDAGTPVYLSPLQRPVAAMIVDAVAQLAARYPVDGIQLSGLALPATDYDYSLGAVDEFRAEVRDALAPAERRLLEARHEIDPFAYPSARPNDWLDFRARRVTALLERLRAVIRDRRPGALVSATILPAGDAAMARAQDWRAWVTAGLIDAVCVTFGDTGVLSDQIDALTAAAAPSPVWVGIDADRLGSSDAVLRAGAPGRSTAAGMILFSDDGLVWPSSDGEGLNEIRRTVFRMPD